MPALPSLSSIEALDHLARLGSMARAAEALNQTPGAISHKIKTLEARLGFSLTEIRGRGVSLTLRAERYLETARPALAALHRAASRAAAGETAQLSISAAAGFASSWLAPRISEFQSAHPNLALTIGTGEVADVQITFRDAPAPGMTFTDANILFSAATAGVGIALGDETTCAAALRSGALVRLFAKTAPSNRSYYIKAADTDASAAFVEWIRGEMNA